jgi:hypothetical protein
MPPNIGGNVSSDVHCTWDSEVLRFIFYDFPRMERRLTSGSHLRNHYMQNTEKANFNSVKIMAIDPLSERFVPVKD